VIQVKQSKRMLMAPGVLNFTMHYKVHNCGGILRESSNNVQQPSFADNYGKVDCAWHVTVPPRYTIQFQVTQLGLKETCESNKEYLVVYNGATPIAPVLARICGSTLPTEDLSASSNTLFVEYHSDAFDKTSRFQFQTTIKENSCGGVLTKWARTFSSPSAEGSTQYPSNVECVWEIQAESGYHIGLTFKKRFFIEDSDNCTKDFVEVFDFKHNDWTSLGKVCGRNSPSAFNSTGPKMKVLFRSDEKNNGDGFTIDWEQNCGGVFDVTEAKQTLASPGYPGNYGRLLTCNYTLMAPEGQYMWVNFLDFEMETMSKQCNFDNLTIHKQEDYGTSMTKMGTYCKRGSLEKFRAKERVEMVLISDAWVERRGFQLEYYLDVCGGVITNSTLITSPMRDSPTPTYQPQMSCYWNITAPEGKKIVVRFEQFDIEQGYDCYFDFVRVFSGREPELKNRLASLCGRLTGHTPAISINNRHGLIHMQTDGNTNYKGFTALVLFTEDCDKTIDLTTELSYDINAFLGSGYKNSLDCHYMVHTKPGDTLTVSFEQFQVVCCENRNDTTDPKSCDYVEVRDGAGPFSEVMVRECGYNPPKSVTTSGSSLYFRFVTDAMNTSTGFVAHVTVTRGQCGPALHNLTAERDIILPPPVPLTPNNFTSLRCSWLLVATPGKMIELEFEEFRLRNATNQRCEDEVLKIADENVSLQIIVYSKCEILRS
jgi:cubilin